MSFSEYRAVTYFMKTRRPVRIHPMQRLSILGRIPYDLPKDSDAIYEQYCVDLAYELGLTYEDRKRVERLEKANKSHKKN